MQRSYTTILLCFAVFIFNSEKLRAQYNPETFPTAIFAETVYINGATVIDSFDSTDPNFSSGGVWSGTNYSHGNYDETKRKANGNLVVTSRVTDAAHLDSAKIFGSLALSGSAVPEDVVSMGPNASIGDIDWVASGNLGIQDNHLLTGAAVQLSPAVVPFTGGSLPMRDVGITNVIVSEIVSMTQCTNSPTCTPPGFGGTLLPIYTNVTTANYPTPGSYQGEITTNLTQTTTTSFPSGSYDSIVTNTTLTITASFPAEGTYVNNITTNTTYIRRASQRPEEGTYVPGTLVQDVTGRWDYSRIDGYTYEIIVSYTYSIVTGYTYDGKIGNKRTHSSYVTNYVVEFYDYIFDSGDYITETLNGTVLVRGNARIHVTGNVEFSAQEALCIGTNASLEFYAGGQSVVLGGSGVLNLTQRPDRFQLIGLVSNSNITVWRSMTGIIYAPNSDISILAGSGPISVVAAVVARKVSLLGPVNFHYDESLHRDPVPKQPIVITRQPLSQTVPLSSNVVLSVEHIGTYPISYNWWKNGIRLTNTAAQQPSLSFIASPETAGAYHVVISNVLGAATSEVAQVSLELPSIKIITQPQSVISAIGSNAQFFASATSSVPLSYQWLHNNLAIPDANEATLELLDVQYTDRGEYRVLIDNGFNSLISEPAQLTFVFTNTSFLSTTGVFHGLFYEATNVAHHSSGFFTSRVSTNGGYSAKLVFDGDTVSFSGKLGLNGRATNYVKRARLGKPPLTVTLQADFADHLYGTVAESNSWSSEILSDRVYFNFTNLATAFTGRYTMLLPASGDPEQGPTGFGFGTILVNTNGKISRTVVLPEGTVQPQVAPVNKNGEWPFYAQWYLGTNYVASGTNILKVRNNKGSILGWVSFAEGEPKGKLSWIKTAHPSKLHSAGFTNDVEVVGSPYVFTRGTRLLALTNAVVTFTNGNLPALTNYIILKTNNLVTSTTTNNSLRMSFLTSSGLMQGSVRPPGMTNRTAFSGVVLQNQNIAAGRFVGTNQTGGVFLQSVD